MSMDFLPIVVVVTWFLGLITLLLIKEWQYRRKKKGGKVK